MRIAVLAPDIKLLQICHVAEFVEHSGVVLFARCNRSIGCIGFDCFVEPDALPWMTPREGGRGCGGMRRGECKRRRSCVVRKKSTLRVDTVRSHADLWFARKIRGICSTCCVVDAAQAHLFCNRFKIGYLFVVALVVRCRFTVFSQHCSP